MALTATPSSQPPAFTSGCAKGENTATCTVGTVPDGKTVSLHAQIPVAADATTVSSVTLTATATASIVSTAKSTPPAAHETVAVTTTAPASAAKLPARIPVGTTVPLGSLPDLNGVSSSLIGAGNAAGLFPAISPAATPRPSSSAPVRHAASIAGTTRSTEAVAYSSTIAPVLTSQVAGLIALAVGLMLTVTRLSLRKRFRALKQGR